MSHTAVRYSQNFLRDPRLVERLHDASSISQDDLVIEIGPGAGALTDGLARRAGRVIAIELDIALAERLRRLYAANPRVDVRTGDFLEYELPQRPYKVFANIPFAYTREIVTRLTSAVCPPREASLVMQREAAEKFRGVPREYLFSILLKPWFELEITHHFRRGDFMPVPSVEVVMLRIRKRGPPLVAPEQRQFYRDFAAYSFSAHHGSFDRVLRDALSYRQRRQALKHSGIDPNAAPSSISFSQLLQLFHDVARVATPQTRQTFAGSERRLRRQQARLRVSHRTRTAGDWRDHARPRT